MIRSLLVGILVVGAATALTAGDYATEVEKLGNKNERSGAIERLAKAGDEVFEDLMDGLKLDPDEEGLDDQIQAERSDIRQNCARLLGTLGDTRASAKLLEILRAQSGESPAHPWLAGECANSLGRIWADSEGGERDDVIEELKKQAGNPKQLKIIREGALRGLAHAKAGAEVATPLIGDAEAPPLLRSAAIAVVVATETTGVAEALMAIWAKQREGESAGYTNPLGVQALFAMAELGDERAVDGLIDVATLNEFATFASLRSHAVRLAKQDDFRADAVIALVGIFKDVDKPTQRQRTAQTLGEFGGDGVTAFLDIADDDAPTPKEGEPEDKYAEDYYKKEVDRWLSSLRTDVALSAFVDAYEQLPEDADDLRTRVVDHLLGNRHALKDDNFEFFRTAANDARIEALKRASAINAWAEAKGKESLNDLEAWAKSDNGVIRAQAVQNLGRSYIPLSKSTPFLKEALVSEGEDFAKARQNALSGLQRSDDKELLPLFLDRMDPEKESDPEVRRTALQAIDTYRRNAGIDDDEIYDSVKARVKDANADVRGRALRLTVTMAQRMGNKNEAVEMVETGLVDEDNEVRVQAYQLVSTVVADIDAEKVIRAALLEQERDLQGAAVIALSRLDRFGADEAQQKRLADLALKVIDNQGRESYAKTLIGRLFAASPGLFQHLSDELRAKIESYATGANKNLSKVPVLIRALIEIQDVQYFNEVKKLAEEPNVELRRAAVEYIEETGTKNDIPFLRKLMERTDAAAAATRTNIEAAIGALESKE